MTAPSFSCVATCRSLLAIAIGNSSLLYRHCPEKKKHQYWGAPAPNLHKRLSDCHLGGTKSTGLMELYVEIPVGISTGTDIRYVAHVGDISPLSLFAPDQNALIHVMSQKTSSCIPYIRRAHTCKDLDLQSVLTYR